MLDLTPSKEKARRAESKLKNLIALANGYAASRPLTLREEVVDDVKHTIGRVTKFPPADIAWELVEANNHLRDALDKAVVALVEKNGRGVSGVSFPFGGQSPDGKPEPFPSARHDGLEKKLTPDQWRFVLAQKPYPAGDDYLWGLNQIANQDKHRKDLVKVRAIPRMKSFAAIGGTFSVGSVGLTIGSDPQFEHILSDKECEAILFSVGANDRTHANINYSAGIEIIFGDISPVTGKEILSTLDIQVRTVNGILDEMMRVFS